MRQTRAKLQRAAIHHPRPAYCTGCGVVFKKMHLLFEHRGPNRCGGRFLPDDEWILLMQARELQQEWDNNPDDQSLWRASRAAYLSFISLRKTRLKNTPPGIVDNPVHSSSRRR